MISKKHLVVKSNQLTQARYRLSLVETQILIYAACQARQEGRGLSSKVPVVIHAREFAEAFSLSTTSIYSHLKAAASTLYERKLEIREIDQKTGKLRRGRGRWVSEATWIDDEGSVAVQFTDRVIPHIELTCEAIGYSSYELSQVTGMTSAYAIRMYELLNQYKKLGKRELKITELRDLMQILPSEYPRLFDLKKNVIDIAVEQINARSNLQVSYVQKKAGRVVDSLIFTIKLESNEPKKPDQKEAREAAIALLAIHHPGKSREEVYQIYLAGQKKPKKTPPIQLDLPDVEPVRDTSPEAKAKNTAALKAALKPKSKESQNEKKY